MTTSSAMPATQPRTVAVVGASSIFGALMLRQLETSLPDCRLVSMDTYPLRWPVKRISAWRVEPSTDEPFLHIDNIPQIIQSDAWDSFVNGRRMHMVEASDTLEIEQVDTVVHVGSFYDQPGREEFLSQVQRWAFACRMARTVQQLVFLSDVRVYGIRPDNPIPLTERSAPQPEPGHRFLLDLENALLKDNASEDDDNLIITVLRTAITVGPDGPSPAAAELLSTRAVGSGSFPMQFLHHHDLAGAVEQAICHRVDGVYNVASNGVIQSTDVAQLYRRPRSPGSGRPEAQSSGGRFKLARCPLILSCTKFKQDAKFQFKYSSEQAVRAFCNSYLHEPSRHNGIAV